MVQDPSLGLLASLHDERSSHYKCLFLTFRAQCTVQHPHPLRANRADANTSHVAQKHLNPEALSTSALQSLYIVHVEDVHTSEPSTAGRVLLRRKRCPTSASSVCVAKTQLYLGRALQRFEVVSAHVAGRALGP